MGRIEVVPAWSRCRVAAVATFYAPRITSAAGGWKLAGALGAFVGPGVLVKLLMASVFVVGVMFLVLVIYEGRLRETLRNVGRLVASLVGFRMPGPEVSARKSEPLISYGVALAFTVMLYGIARSLGWTA